MREGDGLARRLPREGEGLALRLPDREEATLVEASQIVIDRSRSGYLVVINDELMRNF